MARRGWSAANFLRYSAGVATATPVTMAAWAKTSLATTNQHICGLHNSSYTTAFNSLNIGVVGNLLYAASGDNSSTGNANGTVQITTNTWFHACGVFASSVLRTIYLNGGNAQTNTTSITPAGIDRTSVGIGDSSSATFPFANGATGDIAEVAFWNAALTAAEVAMLALGISPLKIRPQSLIGYWPLIGTVSPEPNRLSNTSKMTMQGTLTASAHPRVFMPKRPLFRTKLSISPGVGASAGLGAAAAVGAFTVQSGGGVAVSAGTGAATGVSRALAESVGSSDGAATVSGLSTSFGDGAAAGVATVAGVGSGAAAAVASAAGVGAAAAQSSNVFGLLGGVWTRDSSLRVNNGGVWVPVIDLFVNSNGVWKLT